MDIIIDNVGINKLKQLRAVMTHHRNIYTTGNHCNNSLALDKIDIIIRV